MQEDFIKNDFCVIAQKFALKMCIICTNRRKNCCKINQRNALGRIYWNMEYKKSKRFPIYWGKIEKDAEKMYEMKQFGVTLLMAQPARNTIL